MVKIYFKSATTPHLGVAGFDWMAVRIWQRIAYSLASLC
jgi:hypothetical protein